MLEELKLIHLGQQLVGPGQPPFIVAELSGNHKNSLDRAIQLVEAAAEAGVDAVKLQTYTADTMTLNLKSKDFVISDPKSLWDGRSLYELYQEANTPWEWHEPIFKRCRELGVLAFSTPFDETAVDFLEQLKVPFYKIASFENQDIPLIQKIARTKKPLIVSCGMSRKEEIQESVLAARAAGVQDLILLKCTSTYPASPQDTHLLTIPDMRESFKCLVGLSDHTMGVGASVAAVALGAVFIEKHFCLSRAEGGVDSAFSLEPAELKSLVVESRRAWEALGHISYGPTKSEKASLQFRRSLYFVRDLEKGQKIGKEDVRNIRPGFGLAPKAISEVIGRRVNKDIQRGMPVQWDLIDEEA